MSTFQGHHPCSSRPLRVEPQPGVGHSILFYLKRVASGVNALPVLVTAVDAPPVPIRPPEYVPRTNGPIVEFLVPWLQWLCLFLFVISIISILLRNEEGFFYRMLTPVGNSDQMTGQLIKNKRLLATLMVLLASMLFWMKVPIAETGVPLPPDPSWGLIYLFSMLFVFWITFFCLRLLSVRQFAAFYAAFNLIILATAFFLGIFQTNVFYNASSAGFLLFYLSLAVPPVIVFLLHTRLAHVIRGRRRLVLLLFLIFFALEYLFFAAIFNLLVVHKLLA